MGHGSPKAGQKACLDVSCFDDLALVYRALGHPARLAILDSLSAIEGACCGEIVNRLPLAQSTVSQHLQVLKEAGLLECQPSGRTCHYRLNADRLAEAKSRSGSYLEQIAEGAISSENTISGSCTQPETKSRETSVD